MTAARAPDGVEMRVVDVARLDLAFAPRPWPFADERRAEIDAHFAALRKLEPRLWNGRVLVMHRFALADGIFRGAYLETDFASFIAWRDWGFPDRTVHNCFGMGALRGSDGAFLLGRMNAHTANAGLIYFPCGTPDPNDVVGERVDLAASVCRELSEETGLMAEEITMQPGWCTVFAGPRIAQIKVLQAREPAQVLRTRIRGHLARDAEPELADVLVVHSRADFDPKMPPFVTAFLEHVWAAERAAATNPRAEAAR